MNKDPAGTGITFKCEDKFNLYKAFRPEIQQNRSISQNCCFFHENKQKKVAGSRVLTIILSDL